MKIYSAVSGPLKVNTYFIVNEQTKEGFVIDAGANYHLVEEAQKKFDIKIVAVLLTHAHFDHSRCSLKLQEMGIKIYLSKLDTPKIYNGGHLGGKNFPEFTPDYTFEDGEVLSICGIEVKIMITPGHTDGSACFIIENNILVKYNGASENVIIPSSVKVVGEKAFYENNFVKSITFENGSQVTEIGLSAFSFCQNLQSICLPNSI